MKSNKIIKFGYDEIFKIIFEKSPDGIVIADLSGKIIKLSPAVLVLFNLKNINDAIGKPLVDFVDPIEEEKIKLNIDSVLNGSDVSDKEYIGLKKCGTKFNIEISSSIINDKNEGSYYLLLVIRDITERKNAEKELLNLNSILLLNNQVNNLIIRANNHQQLFEESCKITTTHSDYKMCWISSIDEINKTITPICWSGEENGYLKAVKKISLEKNTFGSGPSGTAAREGKISICNDISTDPIMEPWRNEAIKRGFFSSIALPIKYKNKTIGTFNLYVGEKNFFSNPNEVELLQNVTSNISFSYEKILIETERVLLNEKVIMSEFQYRSLFEQASDAIYTTDFKGIIQDVNEKMCKLFGYSKEDLIGLDMRKLIDPISLKNNSSNNQSLIEGIQLITEKIMVRKNGSKLYIESNEKCINNDVILVIARDITERKKLENELLKNENKFKLAFQTGLDGYYITNTNDGKFIEVNKVFGEIFGYNESEMIGKTVKELGIYCNHTDREKMIAEINIKGFVKDIEIQGKKKNGEIMSLLFSNTRFLSDNIDYIIGSIRDITEKKKADELLISSNNRLQIIIDSEPECIKMVSKEGTLLEMNPAGLAMIEAENFEMVKGASVYSLILPEFHSDFKSHLERIFKGESEIIVFQIKGLKGNYRWLENHSVPFKDIHGNVISVLAVTRDVTQKINDEKTILENNERYNLVAKATNDAIWDWNLVTNEIVRIGEGFKVLFGYNSEDIENIYKDWSSLIHPEDVFMVKKSLDLALNNPKDFNWIQEYKLMKANGDFAYVSDKAYIIRNAEGKAIRMIGASQNITERVKHLNDIELQNKKLQEIAWIQSHVVRAPLSRMMGIVNFLKDVELNTEEFKEWLGHFTKSSEELDSIIHNISNKTYELNLKN